MTRLVVALVVGVIAFPSLVRADAIMPFEGDCPPGLDRGLASHSEVCRPRPCTTDAQCGAGAACRDIAECWAPRPFSPSGGRDENDDVIRDQVIGLCTTENTCAEGLCHARRQCEPTHPTPAWNPALRRWTSEPHRAPPASGCAVTHATRSVPGLLLAAGTALALATRRRRRS